MFCASAFMNLCTKKKMKFRLRWRLTKPLNWLKVLAAKVPANSSTESWERFIEKWRKAKVHAKRESPPKKMDQNKIQELEHKLGVHFKNHDLLFEALTHRSYINERPDWHLNHNERLEFLGDAVLELVVTEHLFRNFNEPEGVLTSWRAALVNSSMLAEIFPKNDLNCYIFFSLGGEENLC